MLRWDDDLAICDVHETESAEAVGGAAPVLYLDAKRPRALSFVSHAHSDHLAPHARAILTPATARLARLRVEIADTCLCECGSSTTLPDDQTSCRLLPAGHVLGSAMLHVTRSNGSLLYTGDFKLRDDLTSGGALTDEHLRGLDTDWLVMESTYGLPMFRFPPRQQVMDELVMRCADALAAGRQPIVLGYSLGKAQEVTRILSDAGIPVTQHGAAWNLTREYEALGVPVSTLAAVRKYDFNDFHGPTPLDLRERGVLIAPPHVARTSFVTRFENPLRIVLTGWALLQGAQYRYGVDHALPLSDHADFDELLELIERVNPKRGVFTHHGYPEFVDHLRARGIDAKLARPEAQLSLFPE